MLIAQERSLSVKQIVEAFKNRTRFRIDVSTPQITKLNENLSTLVGSF